MFAVMAVWLIYALNDTSPSLNAVQATAATEDTRQGKPSGEKASGGEHRPDLAAPGKPAPTLAVQEWVRGEPATLDDLKGKVVLLDIFQIICPGCRAAHPYIVQMQKRYGDQGFQVLGLAVAFEYFSVQTPEHIRHYVEREAFPYPVAIDQGLIESFRKYRARGTPYAALIDREGRIRYLDFFRPNRVEALVQELLNENASR